jgi:hypothetical protein
VALSWSEGNSYSNGNSFSGSPRQSTEPWFIRVLLAPIQDRGPV